jgi:hypothetical protein
MRRALIIGINDYPTAPLNGCVRDATSLAAVLEKNGDGSPNFDVRLLISNESTIDTATLNKAVDDLFAAEADTVLFFFAGHGSPAVEGRSGYLLSQDAKAGALGLSMAELVAKANNAHAKIKSIIIVLDSCHSGATGEAGGILTDDVAAVGKGVILLSACDKDGYAHEKNGHGVFTDIMLDALSGTASDIRGHITPAAVYAQVDQTLGSWEQRPVFKANVQTFVTLRSVTPKIDPSVIRKLPTYFPDETSIFPLDPQYEPDRDNIPEEFRSLAIDPVKTAIFAELQACNRHGLIIPVDVPHMYDAAIKSTGCRLTAQGALYRRLAESKRL